MKALPNILKIIAIFVHSLTIALPMMSYLTKGSPVTYNQREMIITSASYKAGNDNVHPSCTISHEVSYGQFQMQ
ncbi:hypothetical protein ACRQ5D_03810 [Mucilaginibacter sp. P25]|uniref:Uncharacterized protein n=1 Tax=Mucilaginibacter gossypii TaxID=551996 RepID=A0A1G7VH89_9SPHI|nr:hypothetical protein [Mucilaginibacter gossypii]SDG59104.1 hypothetical protein SAMN05192573_10459 [Mucilaginibacter gossypii]